MEVNLEIRPNNFDGFSYFIKQPADLNKLDSHAAVLLEPGQIDFLQHFPHSLEDLVMQAAVLKNIPNMAKWLASLWNVPLTLEVHTTSELYHLDAVWLRFDIQGQPKDDGQPAWQPAINLLGWRNQHSLRVPESLSAVYRITGEINHHGYGIAGRLHHPVLMGNEAAFFETRYNDRAFYQLPDFSLFWELHGSSYATEQERKEFGLLHLDQGLDHFLNLYFGALLQKKELRLNQQGPFAS